MENKINIKIILLVALAVSIFFNFYSKNSNNKTALQYSRPDSITAGKPITQSATCKFLRVQNVTLEDRDNAASELANNTNAKIFFESNAQKEPNIVAFIDLDTNAPKLKGNAGQSNLIKVIDNQDTVSLIEEAPVEFGSIIVYTIFKKERVATWSKQYKLVNIPFGLMAMGYCD